LRILWKAIPKWILIGLVSLQACTETPNTRSQNDLQIANISGDDSDEKVDVPNNITGSYLYCQPLLDQVEGQMVHKAGCSILDAYTGAKIALESVSQSTEWAFRPAPQSNIVADIAVGRPSDAYHAIYTFRMTSGQLPQLGDGTAAVVATVYGLDGRSDPVVFTMSIDALIIELIDSRLFEVFEHLMP
jgi:hypothetical protein